MSDTFSELGPRWECGPPASDDDEWYTKDLLVYKYGDDPFVHAARNPEAARKLIADDMSVTPAGVFAAVDSGHKDTLELLLETGVSPNVRSASASPPNAGVCEDWYTRDVYVSFRDVYKHKEWKEWFPLHGTARTIEPMPCQEDRDRQIDMMRFLLQKGADPYALYREALFPLEPYPFPGDAPDEDLDPPWEDHFNEFPPAQGRKYGTRSVIHSIFEDGGQVRPFFDDDFPLDLEHRDPQGRTILHSACRSAIGADALLDTIIKDVEPGPFNPNAYVSAGDHGLSLFHALRLKNADLLAVDANGKHVLHHLLDSRKPLGISHHPPMIQDALSYILSNLTQLANTPDRHGTYPLHSALQRWQGHRMISFEIERKGLESVVYQLLDAGADPLALDSRGNTALHYLAVHGLAAQLHGEAARRMFYRFLQLGVNVNARNAAGRRAIDLLVDDDGKLFVRRATLYRGDYCDGLMANLHDVEDEVFAAFDEAGVRWTETDSQGRTLLHMLARHATVHSEIRASYLVKKGLDVLAKDAHGKTALDIAEECGCRMLLARLRLHIK